MFHFSPYTVVLYEKEVFTIFGIIKNNSVTFLDFLDLKTRVWLGLNHKSKYEPRSLFFGCIENNACTQVTNCFSAHKRVILVFSKLRSIKGNKHQNNTRVSAETVRHESTYIILFLTRHNKSINDDKNDNLYTSSPCLTRSVFVLLMTSQSIADNVTMTRQYDVIMWVVISNSLYMDFIHSDIHGLSYKKPYYFWIKLVLEKIFNHLFITKPSLNPS